MVRRLVVAQEPEEAPAAFDVPPPVDRVARAEWERDAAHLPPGPPWDAAEQLAEVQRSVQFLIDNHAAQRRLTQVWHDRYVAQEEILRKIVMAADCGRSLTKHLEAARELLPPTRYKRPPR